MVKVAWILFLPMLVAAGPAIVAAQPVEWTCPGGSPTADAQPLVENEGRLVVAVGGLLRIGASAGRSLSLASPRVTGTGVFFNPTWLDAASFEGLLGRALGALAWPIGVQEYIFGGARIADEPHLSGAWFAGCGSSRMCLDL